MAEEYKLEIVGIDKKTNDFNKIQLFLSSEGIDFGKFDINPLAFELAKNNSLSEKEREDLLKSYPEIKSKYNKSIGYKSDVVCLYPEFEHIDSIMEKFGDVHYHFENEYWYIFDGLLGFVFYSKNGFKFRLIVQSGEHIQVPEGIWQQCFFSAKEKRVKSMRFFNTKGTVIMPKIYL